LPAANIGKAVGIAVWNETFAFDLLHDLMDMDVEHGD
jgi:hypothetical protein